MFHLVGWCHLLNLSSGALNLSVVLGVRFFSGRGR